jgi:hypothetical protein
MREDILQGEPELIAAHVYQADPCHWNRKPACDTPGSDAPANPAAGLPPNRLSVEQYAAGFAASLQAVG